MVIKTVSITVNKGVKKIESPNFPCDIFIFDRSNLSVAHKEINSDFICYIIYDDFYKEGVEREYVYFGQSTAAVERLKNHDKSKTDWNKAIIISSSIFDRDMLIKLECDLIERGRFSHNYKVENKKLTERFVLTEQQEIEYESFKNSLYELLEISNINIFSIDVNGVFENKSLKLKIKVDSYEEKIITILKGSEIYDRYISDDAIDEFVSRGDFNCIKDKYITTYTATCDIANVDSKTFFKSDSWSYGCVNKNNMRLYSMFRSAENK